MAAAVSRSSDNFGPTLWHVLVFGAVRTVLYHPTLDHTSILVPYKVSMSPQPLLKAPLLSNQHSIYMAVQQFPDPVVILALNWGAHGGVEP